MNDNVTPIFTAPTVKPRATEAQIAAVTLCDDWIMVRPKSSFEGSALIKPDVIKESPFVGAILAEGPAATDYIPLMDVIGVRVQWQASSHVEPIVLGGEGLLLLRARNVVAVLGDE